MDQILGQILRQAVWERLDLLDELATHADARSLVSVARTELPRLTDGWRTLLEQHEPDERGNCPSCSSRWRPQKAPCSVWQAAHQHLVATPTAEIKPQARTARPAASQYSVATDPRYAGDGYGPAFGDPAYDRNGQHTHADYARPQHGHHNNGHHNNGHHNNGHHGYDDHRYGGHNGHGTRYGGHDGYGGYDDYQGYGGYAEHAGYGGPPTGPQPGYDTGQHAIPRHSNHKGTRAAVPAAMR